MPDHRKSSMPAPQPTNGRRHASRNGLVSPKGDTIPRRLSCAKIETDKATIVVRSRATERHHRQRS